MPKLHRSQFIKEIKEAWPNLAEAINAEEGLLHFETTVVRKFAQDLISSGDREALAQCFAIIEKYEAGGNKSLRNAIDISLIEDLDFRDTKKRSRRWAWEMLPGSLKKLYVRFHGEPDDWIV